MCVHVVVGGCLCVLLTEILYVRPVTGLAAEAEQ